MSELEDIKNCGFRRYPQGKARVYFDIAAAHEAIATRAVSDSLRVVIDIDTESLLGRLLAANLPDEVIRACIRSLHVDDDSFLTDRATW